MSKEKTVKDISKTMKRKSGRTNTTRIQDLEKEVDSLGVFITERLSLLKLIQSIFSDTKIIFI